MAVDEIFIERDISWLSFNERVLQEAMDLSNPLYERIKFLAIYSSNLDEFFRVRVASLRSFKELKKKTRKQLNVKPKKALRTIQSIVSHQQNRFGKIFWEEIIPTLNEHGVHLIENTQFSDAQKAEAKRYFEEQILTAINPIFLTENSDVQPFLKDKGLYFIIEFETDHTPYALVEIPSKEHPRFHVFQSKTEAHYITFLDEIVRDNLAILFRGLTINAAYSVKISRDAEMYIDDEYSGDLLEKIKQGLEERDIGLPTRFLYDSVMPDKVLQIIKNLLGLSKYDLIPGARYPNFNDFFGFPNPTKRADWHDEPMPPLPHPILENKTSLIDALAEKDYMLHFPYQQYDYVPKMIWEAAEDPEVEEIKITLYRVAAKSDVNKALLHALKHGKKVFVFIEAKARFDEASNLFWGEKLAEAGAHVRYSYPGIKVHTKLLIINRKEAEKIKTYTYLGTGNFNEKTAKLYADHALLTADPSLGEEAAQVFKLLEGNVIIPKTKKMLVSPFTARKGFNKMIDKEIANAQQGKEAYMILKMNSLEDRAMIKKLVAASQAGVKIQLIVRGICCLKAGVEEMTENIEIISILDRFLEHARVYIFCNGGEEKMYTASADWMTRNLDKRIELVMPILDKDIYAELRQIIDIQLNDTVKARILDADLNNHFVHNGQQKGIRSQTAIYKFLADQFKSI